MQNRLQQKFRVMAETIGMDVEGKTDEECMDFVISKIKELSERVGIPKTLSELGVENPDFETLRRKFHERCMRRSKSSIF